eukprot:SM000327S12487  [mRNA]  locus=s327:71351:78507:- [translate_table: standard]
MPPSGPSGLARGTAAVADVLATFYPKFDNDSWSSERGRQMSAEVEAGRGVLEVSVKHSGSLFMYAGKHRGAFAKNSYANEFTAVGVWVLAESLRAAWGPDVGNAKGQALSDHIESTGLVLAFELVTAVLGDHGQRPREDYTIVDVRAKPTFWSTPEIIHFCNEWKLPSNQYWLFQSSSSVQALMTAYDMLYEEGTARSVEDTLGNLADVIIPGTANHRQLQGEIMEGLVARIVSCSCVEKLEAQAQSTEPAVRGAGQRLRKIFQGQSKLSETVAVLLQEAGPAVCEASAWQDKSTDEQMNNVASGKPEEDLLALFMGSAPSNAATEKLQALVWTLQKEKLRVKLKCSPRPLDDFSKSHLRTLVPESACDSVLASGSVQRFILSVHVFHDSTFQRYQRLLRMQPGLWPLYRGFFVEVFVFSALHKEHGGFQEQQPGHLIQTKLSHLQLQGQDKSQATEEEVLMLKMKFLPYKLRTFLIRNLLSTLLKKGDDAYVQEVVRQLKQWGVSPKRRDALIELCKLWQARVHTNSQDMNTHFKLNHWAKHVNKRKEVVSEQSYLELLEPFLANFASQRRSNAQLVGAPVFHATKSDDDECVDNYGLSEDPQCTVTPRFMLFFPGIPGCGKSALCEELCRIGDVGDGREVMHVMGDKTQGRYWKVLEEKIKEEGNLQKTILADKNAPNHQVWDQVTMMCATAHAVGVPVLPASFGTEGCPFDLESLAVFVHRVLQRRAHPGKLDMDHDFPGTVVLHFYDLYSSQDRATLEGDLKLRFGFLVTMPVLRQTRTSMPLEVIQTLEAGLALLRKHPPSRRGNMKRVNQQLMDWEVRLKTVLSQHSTHLSEIQLGCASKKTADYLAGKEEQIDAHLKTAHVTLAHVHEHGTAAVIRAGAEAGKRVSMEVTSLLFSSSIAALQVDWSSDSSSQAITSLNNFQHITVWKAEGVKSRVAGELPQDVAHGTACSVQFDKPAVVSGTVGYM